jgi:tryptophan halogenase
MDQNVNKVVIAGGGTAGWMAAAALSKLVARPLEIILVESESIGTIGVGEATIPSILSINRMLQIPEPDFIKLTSGTFKLGIQFENWRTVGDSYIHSFGDTGQGSWAAGFHHFWLKGRSLGIEYDYGDYCAELLAAQQERFAITSKNRLNYAYHLDAAKYAAYLRNLAETAGVIRVEGRITRIDKTSDGFISSLQINDGEKTVEGDLFIDCSGFQAILADNALGVDYDDWSSWLPANRAWAVQSEITEHPKPYTRAIAHEAGWRWKIPLQLRTGNGLVYSSEFMDDQAAHNLLIQSVAGTLTTEPRQIKFTTGQRKRYWEKNCVTLGLSSGFIEPLESTSIHMIQNGIMWLLLLFPDPLIEKTAVTQYNKQVRSEAEYIRDFIVLHYTANERYGEPFWDHCRNMELPETLSHRIEMFRSTGRVFQAQDDIFTENSWVQVLLGQGIVPRTYHNIVETMDPSELASFLTSIREQAAGTVQGLPMHGEYIKRLISHASA